MNVLGLSSKPLFFKVDNIPDLGLEAPIDRLGEAVRANVRSLSMMQKEALVVSRRSGAAWRLASDEGSYLDGDDEAPCPLSFLTTGMVCSFANGIRALAESRGIRLHRLQLTQDNYYTMKGSALRGTMTGGARDVELEVAIETSGDRDALASLVHDSIAQSPITSLMRREMHSLFSLRHNGEALSLRKARAMGSSPLTAPGDPVFDAAAPAPGDWSRLLVRGGPTPKTTEATSYAGSSLADHQDRTLHVRGICKIRDDGVKHVEQHLYNPHGSIFHFLCDEAPCNGGLGRAPDAATYISAGIAFCYMTQLGRFARISKKTLDDYRIVQDTHFAAAGARVDPVETHVQLETGEDDEFARMALDMGEQTCFLHALCRSEIKTRVRIRRFDEI